MHELLSTMETIYILVLQFKFGSDCPTKFEWLSGMLASVKHREANRNKGNERAILNNWFHSKTRQ